MGMRWVGLNLRFENLGIGLSILWYERGATMNPTCRICAFGYTKRMKGPGDRKFYGSTTLGEKGQVVIPLEARAEAKLKRGAKLLVFRPRDDTLVCTKAANLERFASHLEARLKVLKTMIKKTKKK